MIKITVGENDKNQRLDRFLRKYFNKASLSHIYKMIRKDVKVNGKRAKNETVLMEGDELCVYISDDEAKDLRKAAQIKRAKKQFQVIYEDEELLIVSKPFGLLTHGDGREKKNTLVNQVIDYLVEKGDYVPRNEQTFKPACVNRLDRNTTGMVVFGKTAQAVKDYAKYIQDKDAIEKYYMTIVTGDLDHELYLKDEMVKDWKTNQSRIVSGQGDEDAKNMETKVTPVKSNGRYTIVKVQLLTGRTHQIRLHLSHEGHPIIGDPKYGNPKVNAYLRKRFGISTQLLHCESMTFNEGRLKGKTISCPLPSNFEKIQGELFK